MSDSQWLLAEHQRRNQTTLKAHALFDTHRQRVTDLIKQAGVLKQDEGVQAGRMCVLGAGNCNDLDLVELANVFQEIVLVDIDSAAMEQAVANGGGKALRGRVHVTESTDVTGIFERLQAADVKDASSSAVTELLALLTVNPKLPSAPFDCIVSTCLISQLLDSVILALGANHPGLVPLLLTLRRQHLRTIVHNLADHGRGIFIFDFVSSQTLPNLMQIDEGRLSQTLVEAINAKNFFTGLNPFAVQAELQSHADFVGLIADVQLHSPWRWDIGKKQFAVSAISFQRKEARWLGQRE
ncbi:MAG: hypothetical protein SFV81_19630 [Pirellulaceae bacterium]|nr:hypothetical protein [Pirellulaceae bacterium]